MKQRFLSLCLLLVIILIAVSGCSQKEKADQDVIEKETKRGSFSFAAHDLNSVIDRATTIVHGIVTERGEGFDADFMMNLLPEDAESTSGYIVYTPITIEVLDYIKGEENPPPETVIYNEIGGESKRCILVSDFPPLEIGAEVVIFLNEGNMTFSPNSVKVVRDGEINEITSALPTSYLSSEDQEKNAIKMTSNDYIDLIRLRMEQGADE